jgi:hypothetical protein
MLVKRIVSSSRYNWQKGTKAVFKFTYEANFNEAGFNVLLFNTAKQGKARIACGELN